MIWINWRKLLIRCAGHVWLLSNPRPYACFITLSVYWHCIDRHCQVHAPLTGFNLWLLHNFRLTRLSVDVGNVLHIYWTQPFSFGCSLPSSWVLTPHNTILCHATAFHHATHAKLFSSNTSPPRKSIFIYESFDHLAIFGVGAIVAKKWDPGILDPSLFSGQIRKVEARLGKFIRHIRKIRKVH